MYVLVGVIGVALTLFVLFGSVYSVPPCPYNVLPYLILRLHGRRGYLVCPAQCQLTPSLGLDPARYGRIGNRSLGIYASRHAPVAVVSLSLRQAGRFTESHPSSIAVYLHPELRRLWSEQNREGTTMARILIADDHPMVRAGLRQLLLEDRSISEIGEAASGNETLDKLRSGSWDLLLLDISMPDRSGLDILRHVRATHAATKVLILSALSERQYALNVLRAGASGYLPKNAAPEDLLEATRAVLQGRRYVSPQIAELLVTDLDIDGDQPLHSRLSEREFQVFYKIAAGRSVSAIANELCLSVKTVSTYRSRILEKMNLQTNADVTTYALRNQIIQ
jgi:two-component system invasion response regulator UvrY